MDNREMTLIQILAKERVNDAARDAAAGNAEYQRARDLFKETEKRISQLKLDSKTQLLIDDYISACNACWSAFEMEIYQYGFQDALSLMRNKDNIESILNQSSLAES